jgi:hypothetical protein
MLDPAAGWFEITKANNKSAASIQDLFHNNIVVLNLLSLTMESNSNVSLNHNCGIVTKPMTSHNPQANSILEQIHKVENKMMSSFDLKKENLDEDITFDYFLHSAAWAIRSTYHTTIQATPCQFVFGKDMIHNFAFTAN